MKGFKKLTPKELKKRHTKNLQDKELHNQIENKEIPRQDFNKVMEKSTTQIPFDKKK